MSEHNQKSLSAQVVVKSKSGNDLPAEKMTAENISQIMPAPEDFQKAKNYFAKLGFEVDAGFANSFSITGDQQLFEKVFDGKFSQPASRAVKTINSESELKIEKMPDEIKKIVKFVTFSEPPDFGPGNF